MKLQARRKKRENTKGGMTARQKAIKQNKCNIDIQHKKKKPLNKTDKVNISNDTVQSKEKTF